MPPTAELAQHSDCSDPAVDCTPAPAESAPRPPCTRLLTSEVTELHTHLDPTCSSEGPR